MCFPSFVIDIFLSCQSLIILNISLGHRELFAVSSVGPSDDFFIPSLHVPFICHFEQFTYQTVKHQNKYKIKRLKMSLERKDQKQIVIVLLFFFHLKFNLCLTRSSSWPVETSSVTTDCLFCLLSLNVSFAYVCHPFFGASRQFVNSSGNRK